ncbi:MAG TPA: nucleotide sugar dehydrogenase [Fimbriimonadaceae bacterium]|nr:nucleotide sugar dehydrogenase [Fimbriimonadaceae bacterium]
MSAVSMSSTVKSTLLERIANRSAVVGVVGLGYVGLPFAVEKAKVGFKVIGLDRNAKRVNSVNRGENYIGDVADEELRDLVASGLIVAESDFARVPEMDVIVIAVPTPLTKNQTPDLQYVSAVTKEVAQYLRPGQLISLESTTYPGTTEEVMLPILAEAGLELNKDFFLAHSPERVDPGNERYTTKNTNKVVGGVGEPSLEVAMAFYSATIEKVVPVSSAKAAELVKVFENTFRAVNIALVNELAMLCDRMDLDVWEVLDAAFTKPFGIMPFYPGPGVGGHCIPIDPHYLEWKAKEVNFSTRFIALAGEINRMMPEFVRDKAVGCLNHLGVAASRSRVLILGVAYKADLDDWRESPALNVLELMIETGASIQYHDPYVPAIELAGQQWVSSDLTDEVLDEADLVIITTGHKSVDYERVIVRSKCIFDTRNATKGLDGQGKVVRL